MRVCRAPTSATCSVSTGCHRSPTPSWRRTRELVPDAGDDVLDTARAADLFALVDLAARRGENPVTERAHDLLRAVAVSGDLHAVPAESRLVGLSRAPPRILTVAQGVCLSLRQSRFSLAIASMGAVVHAATVGSHDTR